MNEIKPGKPGRNVNIDQMNNYGMISNPEVHDRYLQHEIYEMAMLFSVQTRSQLT